MPLDHLSATFAALRDPTRRAILARFALAEHFDVSCRIEAAALRDAPEWIWRYRRFWDESFDRLDDYLSEIQERELKTRDQREKEKKNGRNQ
jgi:hypothetical protein